MKKKFFYKQNGPNNKKGSFKNNTVLLSTGVSGYVYHIIYYIPCVYSSMCDINISFLPISVRPSPA